MLLHGSEFFQCKAKRVDHEKKLGNVDSFHFIELYRKEEEHKQGQKAMEV